MKEVKKEIKELTGDFDSLLYYDKEGLEKRMGEWVGKRSVIREMLKANESHEKIKKYTKLTDKEFSEMLEEIEKGW